MSRLTLSDKKAILCGLNHKGVLPRGWVAEKNEDHGMIVLYNGDSPISPRTVPCIWVTACRALMGTLDGKTWTDIDPPEGRGWMDRLLLDAARLAHELANIEAARMMRDRLKENEVEG